MSTVQTPPASAIPDWDRLARRAFWNRTGFLAAIIGFLTIISLPIMLPYLWLLAMSLTKSGSVESTQVLSRVSMIAALAYGGMIAIALFAQKQSNIRALHLGLTAVVLLLLALIVTPMLTLENYRFLWNPDLSDQTQRATSRLTMLPSIWSAMGNSLAFALAQMVIVTLVAAPAAYALSRFAFVGRESFLRGLLMLHAFPALALTVAIFIQMYWMGLLNSLTGVVLVLSALELPFAIFVLKGFFDAVPWDIEMSAVTDGATRFQAFRMVVLPQVLGGLIAVSTFTFLRGWEEYVFVQTLLINKTSLTMSLYLFFVAEDHMGVDYGLIAAVGVIYVLPVLALYIFTQKYLTQMSFGGIKG
jgi:inositol-phosphate transport system permease protein